MEKRYLFTPGPTPVPPAVLAATAEPIVHHRGADFRDDLRARPRLSCATSFAPPTTCSSSAPPAPERWSRRSSTFARPATRWPSSATARSASGGWRSASGTASRCRPFATPGARSRTPTKSERPFARERRRPGALPAVRHVDRRRLGRAAVKEAVGEATLVVDAISSLGAVPLETEAWGIDVVLSGSQKALMCPPGLAFASVSDAHVASRHAAHVLLRLACDAEGPAAPRRRVHPGRLTAARPRRRACDAARGRPRGGVRAARPARSRGSRGSQGDGARAVLARRRLVRRRHGDHACPRESTPTSCSPTSATATASRWRPARAS